MNPLSRISLERRGSQGDLPAAHPNVPAEQDRRGVSEDSFNVDSSIPIRVTVIRRSHFSPYPGFLDAIRRRRFPQNSLGPLHYIPSAQSPETSPTSPSPRNRAIEMRNMASVGNNPQALELNMQTVLYIPFNDDKSELYVEVNRLAKDPKYYFLLLGKEYLLKGLDVPKIVYVDGSEENPVRDFGGGKRSFIQKLCESLTNDDPFAFNTPSFYLSNGKIPNFDGSDESRKCYEILGRIFASCYKQAHFLKTGPMFDKFVYRCLSWFMADNEEDWHLCAYLAIHHLFESAYPILGKITTAFGFYHSLAVLTEEELLKLKYLCDLNGEFPLEKSDLLQPEKTHEVRNLLIQNSKNDPCIQAIRWIALGMKDGLERSFIKRIETALPDQLKLRIEGRYFLDKQMVLNQVRYVKYLGYNWEDDAQSTIKDYFENWLTLCSEEKLRLLVEAITGKKFLGNETLNILSETKSSKHLPEASTCFMLLKIPNSYPSQEHFNQMLDRFLENCFENNGFQTA